MERSSKIVIGITDCGRKFSNYENWIRSFGDHLEVLKLSYHLSRPEEAQRCDGIIMSGGHDIHPRFYNKPEYLEWLDPKEIDPRRDEFELDVINISQRNQKPLLGICRGLQITNVFFGGTLIPDIYSHLHVDGHNQEEDGDALHPVKVETETMLHQVVKVDRGEVNSSHHQAADKVGIALRVNALSDEGIVEGMEWLEPEGKASLMLVQWHPERMQNQQSGFAGNIRRYFIQEVTKWKK